MAKFVLTAQKIMINSTDLSANCSEAELELNAADIDVTNYGSAGWHEHLAGLKQGKLTLNFFNDMAASAIDSIMFPLFGTVVSFEVAGTQSARGTSNPSYIGNILVTDWNPITGKVGDADTVSVTYPTTAAVTRVTS